MGEKQLPGMEVRACGALCKLFKLMMEWMVEQIHVLDNFW